jgi:hypothetical protein
MRCANSTAFDESNGRRMYNHSFSWPCLEPDQLIRPVWLLRHCRCCSMLRAVACQITCRVIVCKSVSRCVMKFGGNAGKGGALGLSNNRQEYAALVKQLDGKIETNECCRFNLKFCQIVACSPLSGTRQEVSGTSCNTRPLRYSSFCHQLIF